MKNTYKGILIAQSVDSVESILKDCRVVADLPAKLEGEDDRGQMTFIKIEVDATKRDAVLSRVAGQLKSPGWYFHLVNEDTLYIAYPNIVYEAKNGDTAQLQKIIDYGVSIGIHPKQLELAKLFEDAYA